MKVEIDGQELFNLQTELNNERLKNKRLVEEMSALKKNFSQENFEHDVKLCAEYLAGQVIRVIAEKLGFNNPVLKFHGLTYDMFRHNKGRWFIGNEENVDVEIEFSFIQEWKSFVVNLVKIKDTEQ